MTLPFVLSIDWDFFVGESTTSHIPCDVCRWTCYSNRENKSSRELLEWEDTFPPKGRTPQRIFRDPVFRQFCWNNWKGVPFIVADCHASIYRFIPNGSYIYNLDYHQDCDPFLFGNDKERELLTCASWGTLAVNKKRCYYEWCYRASVDHQVGHPYSALVQSEFRSVRPEFIFFCLSSPYTHPKMDSWFYRAVKDLARKSSAPVFRGLGAREMAKAYQKELSQ